MILLLPIYLSVVQAYQPGDTCPLYDTINEVTYLQHPSNCSSFIRCVNGKPVLGNCPAGLQFSAAVSVCQEPASAKCDSQLNSDCTSGSPRVTCGYACKCDSKAEDSSCPSSTKLAASLTMFDTTHSADCVDFPGVFKLRPPFVGKLGIRSNSFSMSYCPENRETSNGNIPHVADCAKIIRCTNGTNHVYSCPEGLYYNNDLQFCDEPRYSGCHSTETRTNISVIGCPGEAGNEKCHHSCKCQLDEDERSCPPKISFDSSLKIYNTRQYPECKNESLVVDIGKDYVVIMDIKFDSIKASYPCSTEQSACSSFVSHPTDCSKLVACINNEERVLSCPVGLYFNPAIKMCDEPSENTECFSPADDSTRYEYDDIGCPVNVTCTPAKEGTNLPHPNDCTLYCECKMGKPVLRVCPPGLHFHKYDLHCDEPAISKCVTKCPKIEPTDGSLWSPTNCTQEDSEEGFSCKIKCNVTYELSGSSRLTCTNKGWHGTGGLHNIPSCKTPAEVGKNVVDKINETLSEIVRRSRMAALLFVMDQSGSVGNNDYEIEKNFAISLVKGFPLSVNRTAGVITFSGKAKVAIELTENSTCDFIARMKNVSYNGGSTDIKAALELAKKEMERNAKDRQTLVFLITDGISFTNHTGAALSIRENNGTLFTIGISSYDRKQLEPIASIYKDGSPLFFGISSFEVFSVVADYLNTVYSRGLMTCS